MSRRFKPKEVKHWWELDFKGFLAELKKKKVKLSLDEEAEWLPMEQKENLANACKQR